MSATLRMFTIYDHPSDCPDGFVVREWDVGADGMTSVQAWVAPDLDTARTAIPRGLARIPRADDDAVIVETWT